MRTVGSRRDKTWPIIRKAGINLLFKHGFEGMNLRLLASKSGLLQAGSLYNYFDNKHDFLANIVCDILTELLEQISEALADLQDPEERLRRFVKVMVVWHTKRKKEAVISQSEIRSLPKGHYQELLHLRKKFEFILREIVSDGVKTGVFRVSDERLIVVAILNMLIGIAGWYKPGGRLDVGTLVNEYTDTVFKMLSSAVEMQTARGSRRRVGRVVV